MKKIKSILVAGFLAMPLMANALSGTIYKDPNCGCCEFHGDYIKSKGIDLKIIEDSEKLASVNTKHLITDDVAGCHTITLGGYAISGHAPIEAVNKLLNEKPDIVGITVPGMPLHSPGMMEPEEGSPVKLQVLAIYKDGSIKPYGEFKYSGDKFFELD